MKRLFRILCALSVFFTSSVFLLGINYGAHRLPIHTAKYALAMLLFVCIGLLPYSEVILYWVWKDIVPELAFEIVITSEARKLLLFAPGTTYRGNSRSLTA